MRRYQLSILSLLLAVLPLAGQDASVTLFNSGRVLVRRTVAVTIPAGASTQTLPLGLFDPLSLTSLEPGVSITRIGFDPANSEEALLRRSIGKTFSYIQPRNGETANATLLALDPERWRLTATGWVVFGRPGQLIWAVGDVPKAPVADVQLQSDRARTSLKLMYQSSGAAWSAQYRIFVGASARIEGNAMLQSGRLDLANAEVQLLAGDIGSPPRMSDNVMAMEGRAFSAAKAADMPSEESIGEVHLYTLADRVTFVPGAQTVVPLFAPITATAERRYTVSGGLSYYGGMGQNTEEESVPVSVTWRMDRKLGTPFGDLPLPGGAVSVFDVDKAGRPQLIGQGSIGHTAAGEAVTVATGTAFDVTAKRTQTEFTTVRGANSRTIATIAFTVQLQNAKDSAATVEVQERRGGEWSVLSSSVPAQKRASSLTAFVVTVPAKGSATLTYRLRVVW